MWLNILCNQHFSIYRFTAITMLFHHRGFCCLFSYLVLLEKNGEQRVSFLHETKSKKKMFKTPRAVPVSVGFNNNCWQKLQFQIFTHLPTQSVHSATVHVWLVFCDPGTKCKHVLLSIFFCHPLHFFQLLIEMSSCFNYLYCWKASRMSFQQVSTH